MKVENDFLKKKVQSALQITGFKNMIDKKHKLSVKAQCSLLEINRSSLYYSPKTRNEDFLEKEIVKIYLDRPFYGYRRIYRDLIKRNINIGEKKVRIIKKRLNLKTLYPKPYLSIPNKEHEKHPYLLKNKEITSVNQVWQTDITYLKLKTGFAYLAAAIDVFSRKILSYSISNTMDVAFCKDVINNAIIKYGTPEIVNSDQGSQYTSLEYIELLKKENIKISMNSKGRALDNSVPQKAV